ncbi:glycosyltransferase family 1 protein [Oceanicola sp. 22II-s10i]|uniref:glycosyltransferase family 4 protein n=1 Tax=Oceanicola sp. 22II-s10i TaxID=1317116 RepID=UPI0020CB6DE6|nr:glycosyltransferase family 1 protein [Oceanicola sp. 22II-s10i]
MDRVERAYLVRLLQEDTPLYGLARVVAGYVLLDRAGLAGLLSRVDGDTPWGPADLRARLSRSLSPAQRQADADLRRLAIRRSTRPGLERMLRAALPAGTAYLNTGHSNLTDRVLRAVRSVPGGRIAVLIHDTIPLDLPEMQREGTVARFRAMFDRVLRQADLIICNSEQTRRDVMRHGGAAAGGPDVVVAHLGVEPPRPDAGAVPADLPTGGAYFIAVGTIEPRKNHALLLDLWAEMGPAAPPLLICGARGWRNEDVFARLDSLPPDGPVRELSDLTDGAISALVTGARALLQPSIAEGFGLPPVEAAALGTPVVCVDLHVYREILGDIPVYLPVTDRLSWRKTINNLTEADGRTTGTGMRNGYVPPRWEEHFNVVLKMT